MPKHIPITAVFPKKELARLRAKHVKDALDRNREFAHILKGMTKKRLSAEDVALLVSLALHLEDSREELLAQAEYLGLRIVRVSRHRSAP